MQKQAHNPTPWMQGFGLNHAVEVTGGQRTLYLSGQTASAADGSPMHPGDIVAQYKAAWACLKEALAAAGMTPANLIRLNFYTTDVDAFMAAADQMMPIHVAEGAQVVATLLGVTRLYDPAIMIELEATAVA